MANIFKFFAPIMTATNICTVKAQRGDSLINFFGVDLFIYRARAKTYGVPSKHHKLYTWLGKNCKIWRAADKTSTPTQSPLLLNSALITKVIDNLAEGYLVVRRGTTVPAPKCKGCGRPSLVGAYNLTKRKLLGICFHRYNPTKPCSTVEPWEGEAFDRWYAKYSKR